MFHQEKLLTLASLPPIKRPGLGTARSIEQRPCAEPGTRHLACNDIVLRWPRDVSSPVTEPEAETAATPDGRERDAGRDPRRGSSPPRVQGPRQFPGPGDAAAGFGEFLRPGCQRVSWTSPGPDSLPLFACHTAQISFRRQRAAPDHLRPFRPKSNQRTTNTSERRHHDQTKLHNPGLILIAGITNVSPPSRFTGSGLHT